MKLIKINKKKNKRKMLILFVGLLFFLALGIFLFGGEMKQQLFNLDKIINPGYLLNDEILNSPENSTSLDNIGGSILLNWTINGSTEVWVYGSNDSNRLNTSLLYHRAGLTNGTYTYLWNSSVIQDDDPNKILILHFDNRSEFGENKTVLKDFSRYNHIVNCTASSCPNALGTTEKFAGGAEFGYGAQSPSTVDSFYSIESDIMFNVSDVSMAAWVYFNKSAINDDHRLIGAGSVNAPIAFWSFGETDDDAGNGGKLSFICQKLGGAAGNSYSTINFTKDYGNKWVHLVITKNNSLVNYYINGNRTDSVATHANCVGTTGIGTPVLIGSILQDTNEGWHGFVDELTLWNKSLSYEEAIGLYNLSSQKYYWLVNTTDGTTYNSSGIYEFTLNTAEVDNLPTVNLSYPSNNSNTTLTNVNFSCSFTDDNNLVNATLYFGKENTTSTEYNVSKTTWIANTSKWYYNDSNVWAGNNWTNSSFDFSAWKLGGAYLATAGETGETTALNMGAYAYYTYYFRQNFTITDVDKLVNLSFNIDYDDFYAVYINGYFINDSMNATYSPCNWSNHTSVCADVTAVHNSLIDASLPHQELIFPKYTLNSSQMDYLVSGTNYIAVAIKQYGDSSDAAFMMNLYGYENSSTSTTTYNFTANNTVSKTGTSNSTNFTTSLTDNSEYLWNCYACDNASQCDFALSNNTLTINSSTPFSITIVSPEARAYGPSSINFNLTLSSEGDACWYTLDNGATNITMTKASDTIFGAINSSMLDLSYNVNFSCNNSLNNIITASQTFSVNHNARKFILYGIDGYQWNHYLEMLNMGVLTNHTRLMVNGGYNTTANITGHTLTYTAPGNAELHTGLNQSLNSVTDNTCGNDVPNGNTTFERLKVFNSSIKVGVIYGKFTCYIPHAVLANAMVDTDWWQNRTTYSPTVWPDGTACDYSTSIATKAEEFINAYSNSSFYLIVYSGVPDCSGHASNENAVNYNNSIMDVDNGLGILLDSLEANGIDDNTQIIITADHGWDEGSNTHAGGTADSIILPLITNNATLVGNKTQDNIREQCEVAPTTLDYFGVPVSQYSEITGNGCDSMIGTLTEADTTFPLIEYGVGTQPSGVNLSQNFVYVNVSVIEDNEDTITFTLYDSVYNAYPMPFTDQRRFFNFTGLPNGVWYYNVSVNDTSNNRNTTETRKITLDTSAPYFTDGTPTNQILTYNTALSYDINASDSLTSIGCFNVNDTRFKINCNGLLENNSLIGIGNYALTITINDTLNNINSTTMYVNVTKLSPSLSLTSSEGWTIPASTYSTINGLNCPTELTCNLYQSGTGVSNPYTNIFPAGIYTFAYNTTGNANYTSYSISNNLNSQVNGTSGINGTITNEVIGTPKECRYKKFGYYNLNLPWMKQGGCI